jgi:hypothetical protein
MANEAFQLQGLNGGVPVAPGQTFTAGVGCVSRGLQVVQDAEFDYDLVNPSGSAVTISVTAIPAGVYFGGPVSEIAVTSGIVVAFPTSTDYTVA